MGIGRPALLALALLVLVAHADAATPGARVLVSVAGGSSEAPLRPGARPAPGRSLLVRASSSAAGPVLVVAFAPGGVLRWQPQVLEVHRPWDNAPEVRLDWTSAGPFDLYVVLCGRDPAAADLARRARALQAAEARLAVLQARHLEQEIQRWLAARSRLGKRGGTLPAVVGGLKRQSVADANAWRQAAEHVPLDGAGAAIVLYRHRP